VTGRAETAFGALAQMNPVAPGRAESVDVDGQVARIVATPRPTRRVDDRGRHRRVDRSCAQGRPRYGALGLAASALLAVVASLLWVSPSAGAPSGRAADGSPHAGPVHVYVAASGSMAGGPRSTHDGR
jgi:hypothetical protein